MVLLLSLLEREANDRTQCLVVRVEFAKISAFEMHQRYRKLGSIRKLMVSALEMYQRCRHFGS